MGRKDGCWKRKIRPCGSGPTETAGRRSVVNSALICERRAPHGIPFDIPQFEEEEAMELDELFLFPRTISGGHGWQGSAYRLAALVDRRVGPYPSTNSKVKQPRINGRFLYMDKRGLLTQSSACRPFGRPFCRFRLGKNHPPEPRVPWSTRSPYAC